MLINQPVNQLYSAGLSCTSVINLSLSKILKSRCMIWGLVGTADNRWPCGWFGARVRKQVCSFVFHCHRQPLCGHRTARKMKHIVFGKMLRLNNGRSA